MRRNYRVEAQPRMFEQVAKQISEYIQAEQLEAGTKLPTERQLSELLEVSRSSVREGIRVLELLHYLDSKQGEGTFVSTPPPFLIPSRVINQSVGELASKHYLGIALMCAENILKTALQQSIPCSQTSPRQNSWKALSQFILSLAEKLDNPYLAFLWSESFAVAMESRLPLEVENRFELKELIEAYHHSDLDQIRNWLNMALSVHPFENGKNPREVK